MAVRTEANVVKIRRLLVAQLLLHHRAAADASRQTRSRQLRKVEEPLGDERER
jgi:hypothetical protein